MENTKQPETKKPLKLKKISIRDLDEASFGSPHPQVSTIMGCNTTGETCIHHCAQQ
ncbi:MAG TPA: hypothetical protein VHU83_15205 [Bryobacteraceae bacterium]|jgi:hypothetical protein|nr:hypothetical protein [Bryobacteraceae bacterium]